MKKKLYYLIPFIAVPILPFVCEFLNSMNIFDMSPSALTALLLTISFVIGVFSPTHRTFDYALTVLMPLSLFCCMFVAGFLDKSDLGSQFHLYKALKTAFQPIALQLYLIMAVTVFGVSFKQFRSPKRTKR